MNRWIIIFCFLLPATSFASVCQGRFVNPLTDICWKCLFPITIGPVSIGNGEDTPNPSSPICLCPHTLTGGIPIPGIPVGFWEPVRLVDVTRIPYCMVNLGGLSLGSSGIKGKGGPDKVHGLRQSFYQVHWYIYPLIYWLELLMDFMCLEMSSFDVAYMSEFDPLWNDDEATGILEPESLLFGNPIAQGACAVDCLTASIGLSNDVFFWCGGCQGGLYPMTGNVGAHVGGVQASMLVLMRLTAKFHRLGLLRGTMGEKGLCQPFYMPLLKKSQYKLQMTYPIPWTTGSCHPMGRTDVVRGSGMNFPYKGEDFGYLLWRKRSCCVL